MSKKIRHSQALRQFRAYLSTVQGYGDTTVANYTSASRAFFQWLGHQKRNWADVTLEDAGIYFARLKRRYAPTTANAHLKGLKMLYTWGELQGHVHSNPWHHVRRARGEPAKRPILSLDDIERVYTYTPDDDWYMQRDRALVLFLLSGGMRLRACARVDLDHLDLREGTVSVRDKGGRTHTKAILPEAMDALIDWIEVYRPLRARPHERALWIGRFGNRIDHTTIRMAVIKVLKACGIETHQTPQDLRRSVAKLMRRNGVPKEKIQKYMGHKHMHTTEVYCDEDDDLGVEAAREYHPLTILREQRKRQA